MRAVALAIAGLLAACGAEPEPSEKPVLVQSIATPGWVLRDTTLYLPVNLIDERIEGSRLADYMKNIRDEAIAFFAEQPQGDGASGSVVFIIQPGGQARIGIVTGEPQLSEAMRTALGQRLMKLTPPNVTGGPIMASLNFDVWGGGGWPANHPTPLPEEWRRLIPEGGGFINDAFIQRVWEQG